jgi:predicted nuclease of predicted toxin-antitoxin system
MKLLLDENLSRRIVPLLVTDFPGTMQVTLLGMERATDMEIWEYARDNGFSIVSKDADFYDLSLLKGAPPKIIWLKSGNVAKAEIVNLLLRNKAAIETALKDEGITCIEVY